MRNLSGRIFLATAAFAVVYLALGIWTGWSGLSRQIGAFPALSLLPLVALSLLNYGLRYVRWQMLLAGLDIHLPANESRTLFFATFLMVITPGKLGEVFKAGVLRERHGVPLGLGLPVVLAERVYDFLGVVALAGLGWIAWPGPVAGLRAGLAVAVAVPAGLLVLRSRRVRRAMLAVATRAPQLARYRLALDEALAALARLLGGRLAVGSLLLSALAWACECVSLWVICRGLHAPVALLPAVFVYAVSTLVGSLVFLPGGLGGTEATMIWLLAQLALSQQQGVAATVIVRLVTLWFAVVLGLVVYLAHRSQLAAIATAAAGGGSRPRDPREAG